MLKSVSRSLSEVGRSPSQVGAFSRRPLKRPAITRMEPWRARRVEGTRRDCRPAYNPRGCAMKTAAVGLGGFLLIAAIALAAAAQPPARPWNHPMTAWGDPD